MKINRKNEIFNLEKDQIKHSYENFINQNIKNSEKTYKNTQN